MTTAPFKPFYIRSYHSKLVISASTEPNQPIYQSRKEGSLSQIWYLNHDNHIINAGNRCTLCFDKTKHLIITKNLEEEDEDKASEEENGHSQEKESFKVKGSSTGGMDDSLDMDLENLDLDDSLQSQPPPTSTKIQVEIASPKNDEEKDEDEAEPIIWSMESSSIPQAILLEATNVFDQPTLLYLIQSSKKSGKFISLKPYQEKNILAGQLWQIREIIPQLFQLKYVPLDTWITPREPVYHNSLLSAQNESESTLFIAVKHQGEPHQEDLPGYNIIHLNSGLFITVYNGELLLTQIKEEASEFLLVPSKEAEGAEEEEDIPCTIQCADEELSFSIEAGDEDQEGDLIQLEWVLLDK
mmetsp:Transcript_3228/g.4767  ORF Transcript_3228/g.4767 Transcript_3228/m.4767 type:complete len:356 (+) Transcript_3228:51-1118(+)